jgi:hypothetical protein
VLLCVISHLFFPLFLRLVSEVFLGGLGILPLFLSWLLGCFHFIEDIVYPIHSDIVKGRPYNGAFGICAWVGCSTFLGIIVAVMNLQMVLGLN